MQLKALALATAFILPGFIAAAQDQPSTETFDLARLSCWEVISLPEDEAAFVMALMIGYLQGQAGEATTSPAKIVSQVEALDTKCADTPDEPALSVLK